MGWRGGLNKVWDVRIILITEGPPGATQRCSRGLNDAELSYSGQGREGSGTGGPTGDPWGGGNDTGSRWDDGLWPTERLGRPQKRRPVNAKSPGE